jgi:hypothetical protein
MCCLTVSRAEQQPEHTNSSSYCQHSLAEVRVHEVVGSSPERQGPDWLVPVCICPAALVDNLGLCKC